MIVLLGIAGGVSAVPQAATPRRPPRRAAPGDQPRGHHPSGHLCSGGGGRRPARPPPRGVRAAINAHDDAKAWALGGKSTGNSSTAFQQGFNGTAQDNLTVTSATATG